MIPAPLRAAITRLVEAFRHRARRAAEQDEEFTFHLEMEAAENLRRGMGRAEAWRAARVRFGGTQRFREETRDARGIVALDNLARDARFALRRLRRARGFAIGVIATLGIGVGAAAGIGTIVYDVLLRDLPYSRPGQLVRVGFITDGIPGTGDLQSASTYLHFAESAHSFTALGAYWTSDAFNITDGDAPERVTVALMTPNVFSLLGVRPILGALFAPGDSSWSSGRSPILISENLWRRRYGADPAIVGRLVHISRGARTIIGVLPRSFAFPAASVDVYYPAPVPVTRPQIAARYYSVVGRLRDGVGKSAAESELQALIRTLPARFPAITSGMLQRSRARVSVESLKAATVAPVRAQLLLLGALVVVVLLIATTNVVNLVLLRTERSGQEIAIAVSLGAGRLALAQRFLTEGLALGVASGLVALPAAALIVSTKFGFSEREIPRLQEVSFTGGTVALVFGCAVAIGILVGAIALTRTRAAGLLDRLRGSRATWGRSWRRAQDGLVVLQVAIALVLLVAAGLLGRSFWNLRNAKIGFDPDNALTFQVSLPWSGYTSYAQDAVFHARLMDRLAQLPGVKTVGATLHLPLAGHGAPDLDTQIQPGDGEGKPPVAAAGNLASPDYFRTMGIAFLAGRPFRAGDLRGIPAVAVSERLARMLFGTTDVVGRRIREAPRAGGASRTYTIVGVVGDVYWARIQDGYVPMAYFPLLRDGDGLPSDSNPVPYRPAELQYAVRGTPLPGPAAIQTIVNHLDRRVPATDVRRLAVLVDRATARVRLTMLLMGVAAVAALLLAIVGVYTVVAYAANGRMREFGIRLALGAAPSRVGGMVLRDGMRLVAVGTVAGLAAALGATRLLRALLYEVNPTGLAEFTAATLLLVAVTLLATLVPARRAAGTHPAGVLRGE